MGKKNLRKQKKSPVLIFSIFILIIIVGFIIDINAGYTPLSFSDFVNIIQGDASDAITFTFIQLRLPRIITAMLVGVGLAVSGCILQGVSRNELADPGIIGINAGACLAVAMGLLFFSTIENITILMPIIAFIGASVSILIVYLVSYKKHEGVLPNRLILNGVAITTALNSITLVILLKLNRSDYEFIEGWISGNIWGASWANIKIIAPIIIILLVIVIYKAKTLNILNLGNQTAIGLGVSIQKESLVMILCSVGLASVCVAVGGGIGFIGLICPHLARILIGSKHELLLPLSALCGMALMIVSDIISRTIIAPNEVSIGIVVAIVGAPYFLYLLSRTKNKSY